MRRTPFCAFLYDLDSYSAFFNESQQTGAISRIFAHHVCLQHVYSAPANQTSSFLLLSILQKINNFDYSSSWYWPDQAKQTNWKRLGIGFGLLNISCRLQECRLIRRRCQSQHVKPIIILKIYYTRKEELKNALTALEQTRRYSMTQCKNESSEFAALHIKEHS